MKVTNAAVGLRFGLLCLLAASVPAEAYKIRGDLELIPDGGIEAQRWEVRAVNADGSLLLGNLQTVDLLTSQGNSLPAMWVKSGTGWDLRTLPGLDGYQPGFSTLSAIDDGLSFVVVGRGYKDGKIEGLAYNYVSGQLHWGGRFADIDAETFTASRFTGVNRAGDLFSGTATKAGGREVPILSRWGQPLEEIAYPAEMLGGWLYTISADGQHGAGFLNFPNQEGQYGGSVPARWTPAEGMVALPDAFGTTAVNLFQISRDGRYIMGRSRDSAERNSPTIWDRDNQYAQVWLPYPSEGTWLAGDVTSISRDGSTKFGAGLLATGEESSEWHALVWHADNSVEYVRDFVAREYGMTLDQGRFRSVNRDERSLNLYGGIQYENGVIAPFIIRFRSEANGFQLLGYPAGSNPSAEARDLSNDGNTIVGIASGMQGQVPAKWTPETGWSQFPFLPDSTFTPFYLPANAVTPDGSTTVGRTPGSRGTPIAFVHRNGQMTSLGYAADAPDALSIATGVSHDGGRVVGQATFSTGESSYQNHAFIWSSTSGIRRLDVPAAAVSSWAYGLSGDGQTAAGWANTDTVVIPSLWNSASGAHTALPVPSPYTGGQVLALSFDGTIAVGYLRQTDNLLQAVYWDSRGAPQLIPRLPSGTQNSAWSVTDDGRWIGGQTVNSDGSFAEGFIFDRERGLLFNLHQFMLAEHGRIVEKEFTPRILRISRNARWMVGDVRDPIIHGSRVPFRIKVPEKTVDDYFETTEPIGQTAFRNTWFGMIQDTAFPLINHAEHGWLSLEAWGESGGYAFDLRLGWLYIDRDNYPYLQRIDDNGGRSWLFYEPGSKSPRRFYDIAAQQWLTEDEFPQ